MHYSFATKDSAAPYTRRPHNCPQCCHNFFYWVVNIQTNTKINFILHILNNEVNLPKKFKISKK